MLEYILLFHFLTILLSMNLNFKEKIEREKVEAPVYSRFSSHSDCLCKNCLGSVQAIIMPYFSNHNNGFILRNTTLGIIFKHIDFLHLQMLIEIAIDI